VKYRLVYTHRAIRDIDALDRNVKQRIGKTLLRYESNPLKHAEPLKQSELGFVPVSRRRLSCRV